MEWVHDTIGEVRPIRNRVLDSFPFFWPHRVPGSTLEWTARCHDGHAQAAGMSLALFRLGPLSTRALQRTQHPGSAHPPTPGGGGTTQHNPRYSNYWAPRTHKRHPPQPAQPRHTNNWAPQTRKRHQQRPTERSDPMQHAKGRTGDCPGPRKGTATRRNVTQGGPTLPQLTANASDPHPRPRQVELVHVLAAAIRHSNLDAVQKLLHVDAELYTVPIAEEGGLTGIHYAARTGNCAILRALIARQPTFLDPLCQADARAEHSLVIEGLREEDSENDLYVHQPLLAYNGRPVFVGHLHGKYIYYYVSDAADKQPLREGWCLSTHLGSGAPAFRLLLPKSGLRRESSSLHLALDAGDAGGRGPGRDGVGARDGAGARDGPRARAGSQGMLKKIGSFQFKFGKKTGDSLRGDSDDETDSDDSELLDEEWGGDEGAADPKAVKVEYIDADALRVSWVPHVTSLLQEAVVSGDAETVQYLVDLYKGRYPQCLYWKYSIGHGLWQDFPQEAQCDLRRALQQVWGAVR